MVFSGGRTGGDHLLRDLSPVQESPENLMPEDGLQLFQLKGWSDAEHAAIANKKPSVIIHIMIAERITASIYDLKTCIFIEVEDLCSRKKVGR